MTAEEFKAACAPYWFRGTMTLHRNPVSYEDNPHYFTAWYFRVLAQIGERDDNAHFGYLTHLYGCESLTLIPHRDPVSKEKEKISHDETVGMAYLSHAMVMRFVFLGQDRFWCLDNRKKHSLRGWQVIRLYPISFYHAVLWKKPPRWSSILYALDCLTTMLKPTGKTSGRMQLLLVAAMMMHHSRSRLERWATQVFLRHLSRRYGTWDNLFQIYFPGHPFTEAVKGWRFV